MNEEELKSEIKVQKQNWEQYAKQISQDILNQRDKQIAELEKQLELLKTNRDYFQTTDYVIDTFIQCSAADKPDIIPFVTGQTDQEIFEDLTSNIKQYSTKELIAIMLYKSTHIKSKLQPEIFVQVAKKLMESQAVQMIK